MNMFCHILLHLPLFPSFLFSFILALLLALSASLSPSSLSLCSHSHSLTSPSSAHFLSLAQWRAGIILVAQAALIGTAMCIRSSENTSLLSCPLPCRGWKERALFLLPSPFFFPFSFKSIPPSTSPPFIFISSPAQPLNRWTTTEKHSYIVYRGRQKSVCIPSVCVCACEGKRERERSWAREAERAGLLLTVERWGSLSRACCRCPLLCCCLLWRGQTERRGKEDRKGDCMYGAMHHTGSIGIRAKMLPQETGKTL